MSARVMVALLAVLPLACGKSDPTQLVVEVERGSAVGDVTRIDVTLSLGELTGARALERGGAAIELPADALFVLRSGAGEVLVTAVATTPGGPVTGSRKIVIERGETKRVTVTLGVLDVTPGCDPAPCPEARLEADRARQDFGAVLVGQRSLPAAITITNRGGAPSGALGAATLGGMAAAAFTVQSDGCKDQVLAPAASCQVAVELAPSVAGDVTASLTVAASPGGSVDIVLAGRADTAGDLAAAPPQLGFGAVAVGAVSATQSVTITNRGTTATGALVVEVTGSDASEFPITTDGCSQQPLAGGADCEVTVRFQPTRSGGRQAALNVRATPGGSAVVALSGTGLEPGALRIEPDERQLGAALVGATAPAATFRVVNAGQTSTGIPAVTLSGTQAGDFMQTSNCTAALPPNGGCDITIRFTPSMAGTRAAQLEVRATPGGADTAAVSGVGLRPAGLAWTPTSQNFGGVTVGTDASAMFTLANTGDVATSAPLVTVSGHADYTLMQNGCTAALPVGGSCQVVVRLAPSGAGVRQGSLDAVAATGGNAAAPLLASGLTPGTLRVNPTDHIFASVAVGSPAPGQLFTVSNSGQSSTAALSVQVTGSAAAEIATMNDGCTGMVLAPAGTCTVTLQLTPTSAGAKVASLVLSDGNGSATAALSGRGLSLPRLALGPNSATYPPTVIGQPSATQDFTLSNPGEIATSAPMVTLGGSHPGDFEIVSHDCNTGLAPGASCTIRVRLRPAASGQRSASLNASASSGGSVVSALSGTGQTAANLTLTAVAGSDFGPVLIGQSGDLAFTVSNAGEASSGAVALAPALAAPFALLGGQGSDCGPSVVLVGSASCSLRLRFTPTASGNAMATLGVTASPGGTPPTLTLTGTGRRDASLSPSPTSVDFGSLEYSTSSPPRRVVVSNPGDLATGAITVSSSSSEFTTTGCGAALAPGASCNLDITARPQPGTRTGNITLSASPGGTLMIPVTAVGLLRLTWSISGSGTVTTVPAGTSCGSGCALVPKGMVTVQARTTNGSGSFFRGWGGSCAGLANDCVLDMQFSRGLTAAFGPIVNNLAFVSSVTVMPNLGGTAPYDAHCNQLASAAGINSAGGDAYIAFISDAASSAITRLGSARGFVRMDGSALTDDIQRPVSNYFTYLWNPILFDERGALVNDSSVWVITGMDEGGVTKPANQTCNNWSSTSGTLGAHGGTPLQGSNWYKNYGGNCGSAHRVYCMMKTIQTPGLTPAAQPGKMVFVTGYVVPGGGVQAFDDACNAQKPAGTGTFKAMVSTTTTPGASVLNMAETYVNLRRQIIGTGATLAAGGRLMSYISESPSSAFGAPGYALTGSPTPTQVGTMISTCNDWTDSDASFQPGRSGATYTVGRTEWWTTGFQKSCAMPQEYGVLCIEQ